MTENERPLFTLTVSEFRNMLNGILGEKLTQPKSVMSVLPRKKIDGMRDLAVFLDRSIPTVQKLKNEGKIPFYNAGNKVFFYSDEVIKALRVQKFIDQSFTDID